MEAIFMLSFKKHIAGKKETGLKERKKEEAYYNTV